MPVATWENLTIGTRAWRIRWTLTECGRMVCSRPAITSRVRWLNLRSLPTLILLRKYRPSRRFGDMSSLCWLCIHNKSRGEQCNWKNGNTPELKKLNQRCRVVARWWVLWWGKVVSFEVTFEGVKWWWDSDSSTIQYNNLYRAQWSPI